MKKGILMIMAILAVVSLNLHGQQGLQVGDKAPEFKAQTDDGTVWDVKDYLGKNYIVAYFYPAAMTGGCTKQACSYRDHMDKLLAQGVVVVGISGDKVENLRLFRQAENLNFSLLSDGKGEIAKAFGVPAGEGGAIKRTVGGIEHELVRELTTKRWTFIIGKDGKILYKNDAVDAEKDTAEVLEFIKLQASR